MKVVSATCFSSQPKESTDAGNETQMDRLLRSGSSHSDHDMVSTRPSRTQLPSPAVYRGGGEYTGNQGREGPVLRNLCRLSGQPQKSLHW